MLAADCLAVSGGFNPDLGLSSASSRPAGLARRYRRLRPLRRPTRAETSPARPTAPFAGGGASRGPCGRPRGGGRLRRRRAIRASRPRRRRGLSITPLWHVQAPARPSSTSSTTSRPPISRSPSAGRLRFGRAPEALHHARHGDRPGQHVERQRAGHPGRGRAAGRSPRPARRSTGRRMCRSRSAPLPGIIGTSISTPLRLPPSHHWAARRGAAFVDVGLWKRAQWFPLAGETDWLQSATREVRAVRSSVGFCDVSTLGKIDVMRPDAGTFLDRVYVNTFSSLAVGQARYGLMLREDGMVMDDGTTSRLAEDHYFVTTTTAKAGPVMQHLEFCRQVLWPELDVQLASATDQWAQFSIAGPRTRDLLRPPRRPRRGPFRRRLSLHGRAGRPAEGRHAGAAVPHLLLRRAGLRAGGAGALRRGSRPQPDGAGAGLGVVPYGTEALGIMRIEKGHVAGPELNGTTTAGDLGFARMMSTQEGLRRPGDGGAAGADPARQPGGGRHPPRRPGCDGCAPAPTSCRKAPCQAPTPTRAMSPPPASRRCSSAGSGSASSRTGASATARPSGRMIRCAERIMRRALRSRLLRPRRRAPAWLSRRGPIEPPLARLIEVPAAPVEAPADPPASA